MNMKRNHGFTLIELMMVLVVLAALLAVAAPNFREWIRTNNIKTITNDLVSDMLLARNEAVKRNMSVTLCRSADPSAAVGSLSCGGGTAQRWDTGWVVFTDEDGDGSFDNADGDTVLKRTLIDTGTDVGDAAVKIQMSSNGNTYVTYRSDGSPRVSGTKFTARITLCLDWNRDGDHTDAEDLKRGRQIDVKTTGYSKLKVGDISKCDSPDNPS